MVDEKSGRIINIFPTLARHEKLLKRWLVFARHILGKSSLPARDREILILRIGWLCQAEYEWGQHVKIGKEIGLIDDEIQGIMDGPDSKRWNAFDATLLRAVDELYYDSFISGPTWKKLTERYNTQQLLDLVFTVGQYNLVSMALNTLGVQLEDDTNGFPI
ncbi:MAG: carboxymuconolactone decarboxylase family protein [Candidatus Hermodarchaeota archaeon]